MTALAAVPDVADPAPLPVGYEPTLAHLLATYGVTLSLRDAAKALGLVTRRGPSKGTPNPRLVLDLARAGVIAPVDLRQPEHRWTFASAAIAYHVCGGAS